MPKHILVFALICFGVCSGFVFGQQEDALESPIENKRQLVQRFADIECQVYVAEPGAALLPEKLARSRFQFFRDRTDIAKVRGIKIGQTDQSDSYPELASAVVEHFADIELIDIYQNPEATAAFSKVMHQLPNLRAVDISRAVGKGNDDEVSERLVSAIGGLAKLEDLELWHVWLTNERAKQLQSLGRMRWLLLFPENDVLSAEVLTGIVSKMPELERLEVSRCKLAGTFDWERWAKLEKLVEIKFRWTGIKDDQLVGISKLKRLESLRFYYEGITEKSMPEFAKILNLKELGIYSTHIKSGINHLASSDTLEKLYCNPGMFHQPISAEDVRTLLKLNVDWAFGSKKHDGTGPYSLQLLTEGFEAITFIDQSGGSTTLIHRDNKLRQIAKRVSVGRHLTRADLMNLHRRGLDDLSYLRLKQNLSSEQTAVFRQLPMLASLYLEHATIDRTFVADMASNPGLRSVHIENAVVEPGAFEVAQQWASLRFLAIDKLRFAGEGEDRLRGIESFPNLETLVLKGVALRDEDCGWIAKGPSLEHVTLGGEFSKFAIYDFANSSGLKSLGLLGLELENLEVDLMPLMSSGIGYLRLRDRSSRNYANLYSRETATMLNMTMAGACSCGCMDVVPAK